MITFELKNSLWWCPGQPLSDCAVADLKWRLHRGPGLSTVIDISHVISKLLAVKVDSDEFACMFNHG